MYNELAFKLVLDGQDLFTIQGQSLPRIGDALNIDYASYRVLEVERNYARSRTRSEHSHYEIQATVTVKKIE